MAVKFVQRFSGDPRLYQADAGPGRLLLIIPQGYQYSSIGLAEAWSSPAALAFLYAAGEIGETAATVSELVAAVQARIAATARDGGTLWAVRIGAAPGAPISYLIGNPGDPELFAPRPASNTLISRQAVPIYDYSPVSGIATAPTRKFDFADVDLDVWLRQLLAAVDGTLTPSFVAALQIVTAKVADSLDYLGRILRAKETLAGWISALMVPLYRGSRRTPPRCARSSASSCWTGS